MSEQSKKGILSGVAAILASFGVVVEHDAAVFKQIEKLAEEIHIPNVDSEKILQEKLAKEIHIPNVDSEKIPIQNAHPGNILFDNHPYSNKFTISEPLPSDPQLSYSSVYNGAIKHTNTAAQDAAFEYIHRHTNEISFDAVRQAALVAARKQNELQGNILQDATVTIIATSAATIAYHQAVS